MANQLASDLYNGRVKFTNGAIAVVPSSVTETCNGGTVSASSGCSTGGGGGSGLSGGAIAGIVIGSVVGAIILCAILLFLLFRLRGGDKGKDVSSRRSSTNNGASAVGVPQSSNGFQNADAPAGSEDSVAPSLVTANTMARDDDVVELAEMKHVEPIQYRESMEV